jgi:hypothetical protein
VTRRDRLGTHLRQGQRLGARIWRTAFGPRVRWLSPEVADIGGQRFRIAWRSGEWDEVPPSTPEQFVLLKRPEMVEDYLRRFRRDRPRNIVEVGVFQGGSAVMLWQMCKPMHLVGIELSPAPSDALARFVDKTGATGLCVHWETDQADVARIREIVAGELDGAPIDFVLDDASHLYGPTKASFEALFPLLRPGGSYVIEDWGWAHWEGSPWQDGFGPFGDQPGMSNLIFELVMAAATRPDVVGSVDARFHHAEIVRGPAFLEGPIRLEELYAARGVTFRPFV